MGVGILPFWSALSPPLDSKRDFTWSEWFLYLEKEAEVWKVAPLCIFGQFERKETV